MGKNKLFLLMAALAAGTASYAQVDVTSLITNPSFETDGGSGWTETLGAWNYNPHGGASTNFCAESWHAKFNVKQELNVPNGIYSLTAQGFYRQDNAAKDQKPYFYANDQKATVPVRTGTENSMSEASASFSAGLYTIDPIRVVVTDEKLTIGVANPDNDELWCIWDNFKLTYEGADITSNLKSPNFDSADGWKVSDDCTNKNLSGGDAANKNAESYHSVFTISQELSVPNGTYYVIAQGFYRQDGSDNTNLPYFFANDSKENLVNIVSVGKAAADGANGYTTLRDGVYIPNSMGDASKVFSSGACTSNIIKVVVTDGKLTVGVANPNNKNLWVIWDNFKLYIDPAEISSIQTFLTQKLAIQINKANKYTGDERLQALALEASKIQVKINGLAEDVSKYSSIVAEIEAIGVQIAAATANYEAYQAAVAAHGTLETKLADLTTEYNKAAKETQDAAKTMYDGNVDLVAQFLKDAKAAYEANSAGTDFADDKITEKTKAITKSIDTAIDAIKNGSTNAFSYANVVAEIAKARAAYDVEADKLYGLLAGAEDGKIYNDTYVEALAKLNNYLRVINKVEEENKAKYDAGEANDDTQKDFLGRLTTAESKMPDVYTEYNTLATTLRANYKAACDDVKSLTADLKTDIEDAIGDKRDEVKNFYADNVAAIKSSIAALQANVDAANVAHTIAGTNPFCKDYGTDRNKITKAISDLKKLVDESVAEFDAHQATLTAIAAAETAYNDSKNGKGKKNSDAFDANYKGVDNLKSDNKQYTTKGRFEASEKSITDAIDALRAAANAAYKVDGKEKKAQNFNSKVNDDATVDGKTRKGLTTINSEITTYRTNAHAALAAYNKVANAIAAYTDDLNGTPAVGEVGNPGYVPANPGLVGTATEKDVTIDGDLDSKSYATAITELEARIAKVQENLDKALKEADVKHKTALEAIDVDATIASEIATLTANYAANETAWNANQVAAAKTRMLNEAQRRIDAVEGNLPATYDAATYGLMNTTLNADLKKITEALAGVKTAKTTAEGQDGATAIAALSEVAKSLEAIEADFKKLKGDAETAKKEYKAETDANKVLTDALTEIDVLLNGGTLNKVDYKSVVTLLNGANNFTTEIGNQTSAISTLQTDISKSYGAETLRKDQDDTVVDGKVTKVGYTNRAAEIKAAVESLRALAELEADNLAAKEAFDKKVTDAKVTDDITKAGTDLSTVATKDGLAFFSGELTKYQTEYNNILTDEGKAYTAVVKSEAPGTIKDAVKYTDTSKNMKAKAASLEARLNAVKANITGLKALADANEKAHKAQYDAANTSTVKPEFKCTSDVWAELFAEVTNAETTSAHEAAIATLTQLKNDLKAYDDAVKKAWGEGKCDTDKATLEAQLTTINNALATFAASWKDTYAAAVAVDNQARKENFDGAYTKLTTAYAAAVEVITKLSKLSYANDPSNDQTPTLLAITGEGGIFDYATKIRTLKDDATTAYETAQKANPIEQFDAEEAYKALAGAYQTQIEALAKTYTDEVNKIAMTTFTTAKSDAETKYNAAVSDIESTLHISNADAKKAVDNVRKMIDNTNGKIGLQDFAYILDNEILPAFATIDAELTKDKETAAVNTWESAIEAADKLAQDEAAALAEFMAKDGTKAKFAKDYADFVKASITAGAEAWGKVAEGKKYAGYAAPWALLNDFIKTEYDIDLGTPKNPDIQTHTAKYWVAYFEDVAYHDNDKAFGDMKDAIAEVQKALDDAKAFIGAMLVEHNEGLMGQIGVVQIAIDNLTADAEGYHKNNTATANLAAIQGACTLQKSDIAKIIDASIPAEEAAVGIEIGLLRNDYDRATAADIENTAIDAYKAVIDGYEKENAKIYDEFNTGKKDDKGKPIIVDGKPVKATVEETQAAFLALEKKIGVTKNELAAIYDAAATANAITAIQAAIDGLNATYADLEAQMAECHEPVQAKYQSVMDAFKAEIDAAQVELETETADNTVLLYEANNLTSIQNVAKAYQNLSADIAKDEAPYDVNDAKYAELSDQLKQLTANLAAVNTAAADYEYQTVNVYTPWKIGDVEYTNYREYAYAKITADIAAEQKAIDKDYKKVKLTATSTVKKNLIQSDIDITEAYLAYNNAAQTSGAVSTALNTARNNQNSRAYTATDRSELNATYWSLNARENYVDTYNSYASDGVGGVYVNYTVSYDIDGNLIQDEKGKPTPKTVKYIEEYPVIMARLAELSADVAEYANNVDVKSYMKGDVNHDRKVNVADYSAVRNIALGFTEADPASAIFYAADVNNDGEITVADVTAIASYIMSGNKYWPAAAAASRSTLKNSDAISVAMTANNGKQQVVISLNNKFEYVAAQMDIQLPAGMKLVGESLTSRANGHELLSNDVNGAHRVLISTLANSAFLNNETALVVLDVEVTDEYQGGMIQVNNAIFADASAHAYKLADVATGETTGIDALSVDVKNASIYDFSGRRVFNVKKGNFYIINGKSVLVK